MRSDLPPTRYCRCTPARGRPERLEERREVSIRARPGGITVRGSGSTRRVYTLSFLSPLLETNLTEARSIRLYPGPPSLRPPVLGMRISRLSLFRVDRPLPLAVDVEPFPQVSASAAPQFQDRCWIHPSLGPLRASLSDPMFSTDHRVPSPAPCSGTCHLHRAIK